ncbi:SCAMP family-domain containing protein [Rhodotorula toruloides]|nr:SCAMP family-domain containing protein [Rhodotorula toruloides]
MADPFRDPQPQTLDSNPFADPAVQAGLHSHAHEEYDASLKTGGSTYSLPQMGGGGGGGEDMQARLADLQRREQELANRESALKAKQEHIRKHGRNNWPPGPFPLLFHSIEDEIPEQHQATVLTLYRIWMFLILVLIVNLVGAILLLISGASNGGADLGSGIMYVPVIGALSFLLWYRPVYNAYAKVRPISSTSSEKLADPYSFFYYIFFLFGAFHIAFCAYMFVGIPSSGSAGLINLISRFAGGHIVSGVFCVLATVGWALEGLAMLWMYKNGHSLAQAKQEIQMYGIKQYLFKAHSMPASSQQQAQV